jgi:excisionase family DNA binding protein
MQVGEKILSELREIKQLLSFQKEVLTLDEFCAYAGISKHQAYHLTSTRKIPFSRPFGKMIYLKKEEVIEFLLRNSVKSDLQINYKSITKI